MRKLLLLTFLLFCFGCVAPMAQAPTPQQPAAQTAGGTSAAKTDSGIGTLATIGLAILIVLSELVRRQGWLPSPAEQEMREFCKEWAAKKVGTHSEEMHKDWTIEKLPTCIKEVHTIVTHNANLKRSEKMEEILASMVPKVDELAELHRTDRKEMPAWFCACALAQQVPQWKELVTLMGALKDGQAGAALNETKIIGLLEANLDRQVQVLDKVKEGARSKDV